MHKYENVCRLILTWSVVTFMFGCGPLLASDPVIKAVPAPEYEALFRRKASLNAH